MKVLEKDVTHKSEDIGWKFRTFKEIYKTAKKDRTMTGSNKIPISKDKARFNLGDLPEAVPQYKEITLRNQVKNQGSGSKEILVPRRQRERLEILPD